MITRMAARNIRRHLRRTIITSTGIALGTALTLFSVGLGDGGHNQMIENGVRLGQGHLTVQRVGYLESPSTSIYISEPDTLLPGLKKQSGLRGIYPRVRAEGILSTASGTEGIVFQGIVPDIPGEGLLYKDSIVDGSFLTDSGSNSIVIGEKLARRLKLKIGKKAILTCQNSNGEIISVLLKVRGIFRTGSSSIDGFICLIPIRTAQDTLSMGSGITSIALYLEKPRQQELIVSKLRTALPLDGTDIFLWQQLQPELRDFVVIDDAFGYLTYAIILFIVAIGVLNTVLMSVMERKREIGILAALGMRPGTVLGMILMETLFITVTGILIGLCIGLGVNWHFSVHGLDLRSLYDSEVTISGTVIDPVLYSDLRPHRVVQLCALVLLLTISMGLYPAIKASRTEPVEAMEKP